jgi:hypothetical protein
LRKLFRIAGVDCSISVVIALNPDKSEMIVSFLGFGTGVESLSDSVSCRQKSPHLHLNLKWGMLGNAGTRVIRALLIA